MNIDPAIKRSSRYVATGQPAPCTTWGTGYSPVPLAAGGSTGFRGLLAETLFTNAGSGSWFAYLFSFLETEVTREPLSNDWVAISITAGKDPIGEEDEPHTTAEKLDFIRDTFGLSMAALATILNASRASLYNWFESEPRSEGVVSRIDRLYQIACDWQKMNPYHFAPGKLMKQRLGDGSSMLERLSREQLDDEEIGEGLSSLVMLMKKQREAMDRARARGAKAKDRETHKETVERFTGSITVDKE